MRTRFPLLTGSAVQTRRRAGVTLVELVVTLGITVLTVTAVISSHIVGLMMYNTSATKLSASAGARAVLSNVRDDIRSAKSLYVGNGNESGFTRIPVGQKQIGNSVLIYPSVNTNEWIRYFVDRPSQTLRRKSNSDPTRIVATYMTNTYAFQAETHTGSVLTNDSNHRVVRMLLEFYQWEFPVAKVGGHYDYYRLHTRVTRRAIE